MKKLLALCIIFFVSFAHAGQQTTSSTTGTALIAQARVYLNESTAGRWSEAELLQYLNDGTVDIVSKTKAYQGSENITLVASTVEYTPTTSYLEVISARVNQASGASLGLKKGNIRSLGEQISDDTPAFWYEIASKVGIYPAYSSVTTETATVYFVKRPAAIAAGGTVPTPAYLDKAVVYYIVAQALLKDRRHQEAQAYYNLYLSEAALYRQEVSEADNETADPIR